MLSALALAAAGALAIGPHAARGQQPAAAGQNPAKGADLQPPSGGVGSGGNARPQIGTGTVVTIRKQLTGDFTYRFVSDKDQSAAPIPLPASAAADAPIPVNMPATFTSKTALLEVVDKSRGSVARIPMSSGSAVTLTEASFKYVQTVFVAVQHEGKAVTDVLVTISNATHKYSMAWPLKATDKGIAQFASVPMGEPITVAINGAGHASISQTNTLIPGYPPDGYHWPLITVDWPDVATVAPAPLSTPLPVPPPSSASASREDRDSNGGASERRQDNGGGWLSSLINTLLGLVVVALIIYGALWAFNKGHVKTLLDKAGINTADMSAGAAVQPSPFDKPSRAPLTPITEGTADPFTGAGTVIGAPTAAAAGPRLVATAGAYSGSIFALTGAYSEIGRDAANTVPLPNDTNSSRRHATINSAGSEYSVTDNGSSNGTFLNGVRIPPNAPQPLRVGDELQVGMTRFRFEV